MGPLKQSASKEDFVSCLGLNLNDPNDKDSFQTLWGEVTAYWCNHFETDDRRILKVEYASNLAIHRPYKWAHINPTVIDCAIKDIWTNTTSATSRHYYDIGGSPDKRVYNWVLKWLLWHVCRYRDWRNRKRGNGGSKTVKVDAGNIVGGGTAGGASGGEYARCQHLQPQAPPSAVVVSNSQMMAPGSSTSRGRGRGRRRGRTDAVMQSSESEQHGSRGGASDDRDHGASVGTRTGRQERHAHEGSVGYGKYAKDSFASHQRRRWQRQQQQW